jgi:hypothetical protein
MNTSLFRASLFTASLLIHFTIHGAMLGKIAFTMVNAVPLTIGFLGSSLLSAAHKQSEPLKKPDLASQQALETLRSGGTIQQTHLPDISKTLESALAHLPEKKDLPVFINLNVSTQQAATNGNSQSDAPKTSSSGSSGAPVMPTGIKTLLSQKLGSLVDWLKNHKIRVGFYGALATYSGVQGLLWKLGRMLGEPACWSFWNCQCSLEKLYKIPHSQICKELLSTFISQKKKEATNPLEDAHHLINAMTKELRALAAYQKIEHYVEKWHLKRFFFCDGTLLAGIADRIQRLTFLKSIISQWIEDNSQTYATIFK